MSHAAGQGAPFSARGPKVGAPSQPRAPPARAPPLQHVHGRAVTRGCTHREAGGIASQLMGFMHALVRSTAASGSTHPAAPSVAARQWSLLLPRVLPRWRSTQSRHFPKRAGRCVGAGGQGRRVSARWVHRHIGRHTRELWTLRHAKTHYVAAGSYVCSRHSARTVSRVGCASDRA